MDGSDELKDILNSLLKEMFNQVGGAPEFEPNIEIHEREDETVVILELPGIDEQDLVCDIRQKDDMPHNTQNDDYQILYISTADSLGEKYNIGLKLPMSIKKIDDISIRNGVIEIILK